MLKFVDKQRQIGLKNLIREKNPLGQEYYWLTGKFVNKDQGEDTDEWALKNNYISIVPVEFDLTAHHAIQGLNEWDFK